MRGLFFLKLNHLMLEDPLLILVSEVEKHTFNPDILTQEDNRKAGSLACYHSHQQVHSSLAVTAYSGGIPVYTEDQLKPAL